MAEQQVHPLTRQAQDTVDRMERRALELDRMAVALGTVNELDDTGPQDSWMPERYRLQTDLEVALRTDRMATGLRDEAWPDLASDAVLKGTHESVDRALRALLTQACDQWSRLDERATTLFGAIISVAGTRASEQDGPAHQVVKLAAGIARSRTEQAMRPDAWESLQSRAGKLLAAQMRRLAVGGTDEEKGGRLIRSLDELGCPGPMTVRMTMLHQARAVCTPENADLREAIGRAEQEGWEAQSAERSGRRQVSEHTTWHRCAGLVLSPDERASITEAADQVASRMRERGRETRDARVANRLEAAADKSGPELLRILQETLTGLNMTRQWEYEDGWEPHHLERMASARPQMLRLTAVIAGQSARVRGDDLAHTSSAVAAAAIGTADRICRETARIQMATSEEPNTRRAAAEAVEIADALLDACPDRIRRDHAPDRRPNE